MKLLTDRLTEDPQENLFEGSPEWLSEVLPDFEADQTVVESLHFQVQAHKMGEDLYLDGQATGAFELGCGRCLKRYRQPVREPLRLVLEPAGARVPADPEGADALARDGLVLSDELETGWFRGPEVSLDHFLAEVVTATLPLKPLCREECSGLCPSCGVDRNETDCDCQEERPASPFAALAGLREELAKQAEGTRSEDPLSEDPKAEGETS